MKSLRESMTTAPAHLETRRLTFDIPAGENGRVEAGLVLVRRWLGSLAAGGIDAALSGASGIDVLSAGRPAHDDGAGEDPQGDAGTVDLRAGRHSLDLTGTPRAFDVFGYDVRGELEQLLGLPVTETDVG